MNKDLPIIITGNTSLDDRGVVKFINDFKFDNIKRFYIVKNHQQNFIRAWHGHKNESFCIYCNKKWKNSYKYCFATVGVSL